MDKEGKVLAKLYVFEGRFWKPKTIKDNKITIAELKKKITIELKDVHKLITDIEEIYLKDEKK